MSDRRLFSAKLNQKIDILENVVTNDLADNWQKKFTCFANIKHLSPNSVRFFEGVHFGNLINETYMLFSIRFNSSINKNLRILFKQKHFLIKKIINVLELDKVLEIIAMEVS
jgi:head-tail adaptor